MLKFFGRGSAFADEHNSAFFFDGTDMVLLDCSMGAYQRIKKMVMYGVEHIYILITHTHGDHIAGIGMLIDFEVFIGKIPVTVVAPSSRVKEDLKFYLSNIEGCSDDWYELVDASEFRKDFFGCAIPTKHTPSLEGKCFGYSLNVDGRNVVYTGDTGTLEPFLPYVKKDCILYTEISAYSTGVHLFADDIRNTVMRLTSEGAEVYLMHMDLEDDILKTMEGTGAFPAPLYDENADLDDIFDLSDSIYKESFTNKNPDHIKLFDKLTKLGRSLVGADRASFWRWDKRRHKIWTTSATDVDMIIIPDDSGLVGKALHNEKVIVTNDPYNDPDFNSNVDKSTGYVTKSILVLPVANVNGDYIGAFQLINKLDGEFDETEDARKLSLAAIICGLALESDTFLDDAQHDKLTGLKNRMGFHSDLARNYSEYLDKNNGKVMSLFICDIDKFKLVNDTWGHNAGDIVLAKTAELLAGFCEEDQCAYRWGGEEFIMLMPDKDLDECVEMAEKIRLKIMEYEYDLGTEKIHKTMSFGCCTYDPDLTVEKNIEIADKNLYEAKETGRNKVVARREN